MNVRLTQRDRKIFYHIYENGYMTAPQIRGAVFQSGSLQVAHQRLFHLCKAGYLSKIRYGEVLYRLPSKSLKELALRDGEINQYLRKKVVLSQLSHDLFAIDCRQRLEASSIVKNWIPAHRLRTKYYVDFQRREHKKVIVPDAIFDLIVGAKTLKVAFEFEHTLKQKSRYVSLIEQYHLSMPVDLLLYVTHSEKIKNWILDIGKVTLQKLYAQNIKVENKLHVATLEELKKSGVKTKFLGVTGNGFSLEGLENRGQKSQNMALKEEQKSPKAL